MRFVLTFLTCLLFKISFCQNSAFVQVQINNYKQADTVEVTYFKQDFLYGMDNHLLSTANNGTHKFILTDLGKTGYFLISVNNKALTKYYCIVEPGDSITISIFDENQVKYSGKGSAKLRYLSTQYSTHAFIGKRTSDVSSDMYFDYLDARINSSLKLLLTYKDSLTSVSYNIFKADVIGYPETEKMQDMLISIGFKRWNKESEDLYKKRILGKSLAIRPNDTTILSVFYNEYLLQKNIVGYILTTPNKEYSAKGVYELIKKNYTQAISERLLCRFILSALQEEGLTKDISWCINDYINGRVKSVYTQLIQEKNDVSSKLAKGNPAYNFNLEDTNGIKVALSDLKGKLVYIDFWASWCGPCRAEMKTAAPELKEKFINNKDLVFLYVSMDANAIEWKKAIQKDKIIGINVIADNAMEGEVAKKNIISSIPRYMIIDRDGNILDGNATPPSDPKTYSILLEYLQKSK